MSLIVKCRADRELFNNNTNFRIISFSPLQTYNELKLSKYFSFTCKGDMPYITIGKDYELEIKEISTDKYGTSYEIISVPSIELEDLSNLTREESFAILMDVTSSQRLANNILNAYENFIELIMTEGKDVIDLSKISGVGKIYLASYERQLLDKYKYYHMVQKYKEWKVDVSDCRKLFIECSNDIELEKKFKEKPYYMLTQVLGNGFEYADKLIMENRPDLENSEQRCEALIVSVLERNEIDGSTLLKGKDLFYYVKEEYNTPNLLPLLKDVAINSELIYYNEETTNLSLMSTYLMECKISDFVKEKLATSHKLDIEWEKYKVVDGFELTDTQLNALKNVCEYDMSILAGFSGCVDDETEYFNGEKWKSIADYQDGESVLQWNIDGKAELVKPLDYIQLPCDKMYHFENEYLNQTLSSDHRVLFINTSGKYQELTMEQIYYLHNNGRFDGKLLFLENYNQYHSKITNRIIEVIPNNNMKYCFTVPSSYLVLRRKDKIFITGNCGKSASIKNLVRMADENNLSVLLLSTTGKASKVLSESVGGRKAMTLHKACYGEINNDIIILDECGMCSLEMFVMLINAIKNPNAKIVCVGDEAQLSAINGGKLFYDFINSNIIPTTKLTEVFRYKSDGSLYVATNLRNGTSFFNNEEMVKYENGIYRVANNYKFIEQNTQEDILNCVVNEYMKLLNKGIKPFDMLILSPQNVGTIGTYIINQKIQEIVNPPKPNEKILTRKIGNHEIVFRVGDIVINTKNDYNAISENAYNEMINSNGVLKDDDVSDLEIMNGQIGIIRKVIDKVGLIVQYEEELVFVSKHKLNNLLLSFCISCHKSQGSSVDYTISIVTNAHKRMLTRGLLYVADTRCRKAHIDIGEVDAFENALTVVDNDLRNTYLKELLQNSN